MPHPTAVTEGFWAAAREHRLVLAHCGTCGSLHFYPRPTCPSCGSSDLGWSDAAGTGTIHALTVARRPTHPKLAERVPYVVAIVALDEGPHLTTEIVGVDPEAVSVGDRVVVEFEDHPDVTVPVFRAA